MNRIRSVLQRVSILQCVQTLVSTRQFSRNSPTARVVAGQCFLSQLPNTVLIDAHIHAWKHGLSNLAAACPDWAHRQSTLVAAARMWSKPIIPIRMWCMCRGDPYRLHPGGARHAADRGMTDEDPDLVSKIRSIHQAHLDVIPHSRSIAKSPLRTSMPGVSRPQMPSSATRG